MIELGPQETNTPADSARQCEFFLTNLSMALKIKRDLRKGGSKRDIALDFTNGDEKRAESLLRQLRSGRFRHLLH